MNVMYQSNIHFLKGVFAFFSEYETHVVDL